MNFKRQKTRRRVRCTLCTPHLWRGNHKGRFKERETLDRERVRQGQLASSYDDL